MENKTQPILGKRAMSMLIAVVQKKSVERKELSKTMMALRQAGFVTTCFMVGSNGILRYFITATYSGIKAVKDGYFS